MLNEMQHGELFDPWGDTLRLSHFEVTEWIRLLKEKADITVESVKNTPPSTEQITVVVPKSDIVVLY